MTDINILFSIQEVSLNEIFQNNPNNLGSSSFCLIWYHSFALKWQSHSCLHFCK